jgi:hypothetical protein
VYAIFKHSKLENKMEEHIQSTCDRLLRTDEKMQVLDTHVSRFDEHLIRLDAHMEKLDGYISTLDEHLIRYDEHMKSSSQKSENSSN